MRGKFIKHLFAYERTSKAESKELSILFKGLEKNNNNENFKAEGIN